jgi:cytoskeletal protein RodZ
MDLANLPAQVFIRGYVVQISKLLGLDEKRVADSYMKLLKETTPQK